MQYAEGVEKPDEAIVTDGDGVVSVERYKRVLDAYHEAMTEVQRVNDWGVEWKNRYHGEYEKRYLLEAELSTARAKIAKLEDQNGKLIDILHGRAT